MIPLPYLTKPPYADPCNGCGLCCQLELCPLADMFGLSGPPCEALVYQDGRTYCGIVLSPSKYLGTLPIHDKVLTDMVQLALATGAGCGMKDDPSKW